MASGVCLLHTMLHYDLYHIVERNTTNTKIFSISQTFENAYTKPKTTIYQTTNQRITQFKMILYSSNTINPSKNISTKTAKYSIIQKTVLQKGDTYKTKGA